MLVILENICLVLPTVLPVILTGIVCWLVWNFVTSKTKCLPPGPWGLPVVGYAPFIGEAPYIQFWKMTETYGSVISVNVLGTSMVVLNNYEDIKECFSGKGDHFAGRPPGEKSFFRWISDGMSISQDEGPTWREHRRFTLHTLRNFGFGKLSLETRIQEIGRDLLSALDASEGLPYDPFNMLSNSTLNVVLSLTCDKKYPPDHKDFLSLRDGLRLIFKRLAGISAIFNTRIIPWQWNSDFEIFSAIKKEHQNICWRFVKEHEEVFDENNLKDFIDVFLAEIKAAEREGRKDSTFTRTRLKSIVYNLLVAGSETTSNTLYWAMRILSTRQDIQDKIQGELDQVVGKERLPSIMDKPNLPYLEAFTLELLRFSNLTPLGLGHSNPEAATLGKYRIPARSVILANLWAVNNDPKFWHEPARFDPERFLDPVHKDQRRQRVANFSLGKRSCLGESLARMELFLFLSMILQKFQLQPQDGASSSFQVQDTFIRILKPYQICVKRRTAL